MTMQMLTPTNDRSSGSLTFGFIPLITVYNLTKGSSFHVVTPQNMSRNRDCPRLTLHDIGSHCDRIIGLLMQYIPYL